MTRNALMGLLVCCMALGFSGPAAGAPQAAIAIIAMTPYTTGSNVGVRLTVRNSGNAASPAGATLGYTCARISDGLVTTGNGIRTLPAIAAGATASVDDPSSSQWPAGSYACTLPTALPDSKPLTSFTVPLSGSSPNAVPLRGSAPNGPVSTHVPVYGLNDLSAASNAPLALYVSAYGSYGGSTVQTAQITGEIVAKGSSKTTPQGANQKVRLSVDGKWYGDATTDQSGAFSFTQPGAFALPAGTHTVSALPLASALHVGATAATFNLRAQTLIGIFNPTGMFLQQVASVIIDVTADGDPVNFQARLFSATIKNSLVLPQTPLAGKTVTCEFGTHQYTTLTDQNGSASCSFKYLKVERDLIFVPYFTTSIRFDGDSSWDQSEATGKVNWH